jgi:hypothetical protein
MVIAHGVNNSAALKIEEGTCMQKIPHLTIIAFVFLTVTGIVATVSEVSSACMFKIKGLENNSMDGNEREFVRQGICLLLLKFFEEFKAQLHSSMSIAGVKVQILQNLSTEEKTSRIGKIRMEMRELSRSINSRRLKELESYGSELWYAQVIEGYGSSDTMKVPMPLAFFYMERYRSLAVGVHHQ